MPRNPTTGVYSKPAGTTPSVGQVIDPVPWNALTTDLGNEITNSLPRDGSAPMVGALKGAAGSQATPSFTFGADITTGFYLKSTSVLAIVAAGAEVATFSPAGLIAAGALLGKTVLAVKTTNYTAVAADVSSTLRFTAAATLGLDPGATLGDGWYVKIIAAGGDVTIDPNASETVNGRPTFVIPNGCTSYLFCDGTAFFTDFLGQRVQGYQTGLTLTRNATTPASYVDIAAGAAAMDSSPYFLMQLSSVLTKRIDVAWAVGNNQGGLDIGSVADGTYYAYEIQRSDTGVVDALFSLSASAPTMPANYDRKRRIGYVNRIGGINAIVYSWSGSGLPFVSVGLSGVSAVDFPGIPPDAKRITAIFSNVTMGGSNVLYSQLGTSGGVVSTGYVGGACGMNVGGAVGLTSYSNGLASANSGASGTGQVIMEWVRSANNDWVGRSSSWQGQPVMGWSLSSLSLSGVLDRIRLSASNSMTSGNVTLMWE